MLEVLIAFALVVLVAVPLIAAHVYAIRMQESQIQRDQLTRIADCIYTDIIYQLYQNELSWEEIKGGAVFEVPKEKMVSLPYEGSYRFEEQKSKVHKDNLFGYYLEELTLTFNPIGGTGRVVAFSYLVFMVRDSRSSEQLTEEKQDPKTAAISPQDVKSGIASIEEKEKR